MTTVKLSERLKITRLNHPDDVMALPLTGNVFGINNRMYCNLGSYADIEIHSEAYRKLQPLFSENDLRFNCRNRLFELHLFLRTHDDEFSQIRDIDFKDVYKFVNDPKNIEKYDTMHLSYFQTDSEHLNLKYEETIVYIPLGSKLLFDASNYAYQEIETIKLDNFGDFEQVSRFLSLFQY